MALSAFRLSLAAFLLVSSPVLADETAGFSGEHDFNMYCASCHGEDGKGGGPKAFGLSKELPDLTRLAEKYGDGLAERLLKVIDGRDPMEAHLEREMPVWGMWFKMEAGEELGGAEGDEGSVKRRIDNLIAYVQSLQAKP